MSRFGFRQLFEHESSTYSYIVFDHSSKEAVIIDPVIESFERDDQLIRQLGLKLKYVLETHIHADHITSAYKLKKQFGAQVAVSQFAAASCADVELTENQELEFGKLKIKALLTPGHTDSCVSYYCEDTVFTGDALLIGGCGRTDFQQGDAKKLFKNVRQKLFSLPDETIVYPAHDYKGFTSSTIGYEKSYNKRLALNISEEEFVKIMENLKLDPPKKINQAVPANLMCGKV